MWAFDQWHYLDTPPADPSAPTLADSMRQRQESARAEAEAAPAGSPARDFWDGEVAIMESHLARALARA